MKAEDITFTSRARGGSYQAPQQRGVRVDVHASIPFPRQALAADLPCLDGAVFGAVIIRVETEHELQVHESEEAFYLEHATSWQFVCQLPDTSTLPFMA